MIEPVIEDVVLDDAGRRYVADLNERLLRIAAEQGLIQPKRRGGGISACPTGYWRGHKFCLHTIVKLEVLAKASGSLYLKPIQGSYSTGTAASAGTHAGGGAGDLAHGGFTESQDNWLMDLARDVAFLIYWDRDAITGLWSDHGHFIDPSCPNLAPEAAAQVVDFYRNQNGLANDGPDFGSRKSVSKLWSMYQNRSSTTVASIEALFAMKEWWEMPIPQTEIEKIVKAISEMQVRHPDSARAETGETVSFLTSQWSANYYAWEGFKNTRELLRILGDFVKAEQLDDAERAAAMAALDADIDALREAMEKVVVPEPAPVNPWPPLVGPAYGFDHSGWQSVAVTEAAAASGDYRFAIIKATEGDTGQNQNYDAQMAACRGHGLMTGAYHFGWLSQDPRSQFEAFVTKAGLRFGEVGVQDVEDWGETDPAKPNYARDKAMRDATSWEERLDHVIQWTNFHLEHFGTVDWKYANWNYIKGLRSGAGMVNADGSIKDSPTPAWLQLTRSPLWIAQNRPAGQNETVTGGWRIIAHQFSTSPFDRNFMAATAPHDEWWEFGIKKGHVS